MPVPVRPPSYPAWVVQPAQRTLVQAEACIAWFNKCVQPLIARRVSPVPAPQGFWSLRGAQGQRYTLNLDPEAQRCTCPYFTGINPQTGAKETPHPTCKHLLAAYAFLLSIGVITSDMEAAQATRRLALLWERAWAKMHPAEAGVESRKREEASPSRAFKAQVASEEEACVAA